MTKRMKKTVKAWCIPPLKDKVSMDGWNFYTPVFLIKADALEHASKEMVVRCEITYSL